MIGLYRHHKGELYEVLGLCIDSTNGRYGAETVLYCSLSQPRLFVRTFAEFNEQVLWPDGKMRARFEPEPA